MHDNGRDTPAGKFSRIVMDDLRRGDLKRTYRRDLRDIYEFYLDEEARAQLVRKGRLMVEQAKWAAATSPELVQKRILAKANELNLPVESKQVTAERIGDRIRMGARFTVPLEFPGYVYNWDFVLQVGDGSIWVTGVAATRQELRPRPGRPPRCRNVARGHRDLPAHRRPADARSPDDCTDHGG